MRSTRVETRMVNAPDHRPGLLASVADLGEVALELIMGDLIELKVLA